MGKFKLFIRTSIIGGITVILPVAILLAVFSWIYRFVTNLIRPLTQLLLVNSEMREIIAHSVVILVILVFCFAVGVIVRTRVGKFIHNLIEVRLLRIAPGYNLIKETIMQLLGGKRAPFSQVVLAQIFANETLSTAFVTDEHADGSFTVFVPTGPNPTSGYIFHLESRYVHPVEISVEDAMRSIISCGAGSTKLIERYKNSINS